MRTRPVVHGVLLSLSLALAACSDFEPLVSDYAWRPQGVTQRNLAVMVARPTDLIRGRGAAGADSPVAIAAARRLYEGKAKALPKQNSRQLNGSGTGASAVGSAGG